MKRMDPLMNESLSDLIRIKISARKKRGKAVQGGLSSMGSVGSFTREPSPRYRRVVVKALVVKNCGESWQERRQKHLDYLQREGAGIDGAKAIVYGRDSDEMNVNGFLERSKDDPHEFRFIISAEDASQLDLTAFTKEVMRRAESVLGTKLDWSAVNHHNTDNSHTHIVLRGVNELGQELILDRDFISNGIRNIAKEIVTRELGERSEIDIRNEIQQSVHAKRVSQFDLLLERMAGESRIFSLSNKAKLYGIDVDRIHQSARLHFLESMGLSKRINGDSWYIKEDFIQTLREMGYHGDIIKMLHRESTGLENRNCIIVKPNDLQDRTLKGVVLSRGISNELTEREYVVIEATDGKAYYVQLDFGSEKRKCIAGDTIEIGSRAPRFFGKMAENVAKFIVANGLVYERKKHVEWAQRNILFPEDKWSTGPQEYVEKHAKSVSLLEQLNLLRRVDEDKWVADPKLLESMAQIERDQTQNKPYGIDVRIVDAQMIDEGRRRIINGEEYIVYQLDAHGGDPIEGSVTSRGEVDGRNYICLHATDAKDYYIELPRFSEWEPSQVGDEVRIKAVQQSFFRPSDDEIWKCGSANDFIYDPTQHFEWSKRPGNSKLPSDCSDEERRHCIDERYVKRLFIWERFDLAAKMPDQKWRLDPEFESKVAALKKDEEGKFRRKLKVEQISLSAGQFGDKKLVQGKERIVYDKEKHGPLTGKVTARGIANRLKGSQYLVVRVEDDREFYVELQRFSEKNIATVGDTVEIGRKPPQKFPKPSDDNIWLFASKHGLIYDSREHFSWSKIAGNSKLPLTCTDDVRIDYVAKHVKRIKFLEQLGLAKKIEISEEPTLGHPPQKEGEAQTDKFETIEKGRWELVPDFMPKLEQLQREFEDKMKGYVTVNLIAQAAEIPCDIKLVGGRECIVFSKALHGEKGIKGRIINKGIHGTQHDKPFIVVETQNKTAYLVDISVADNIRARKGDTIKVGLGEAQRFFKKSDFTIAEFARQNGGIYDSKTHAEWASSNLKFPEADQERMRAEFTSRHVKRMAFLQGFNLATPLGHERWLVDEQFLQKMKVVESERTFAQPIKIDVVARPNKAVESAPERPLVEDRPALTQKFWSRDFTSLEPVGPQTMEIEGKNYEVLTAAVVRENPVEGVVVGSGVSDSGRNFVKILTRAGQDCVFYKPDFAKTQEFKVGENVKVQYACQRFLKDSDMNIVEFSSSRDNIYDAAKHLEWAKAGGAKLPKEATERAQERLCSGFIESHVVRMNFLEKYGLVTKTGERQWAVDPEFLAKSEKLQREIGPTFRPRMEIKIVQNQQPQHESEKPDLGKGLKR